KHLSLYHTIGHWIPVGINPFVRVKQVLSIGIWFRIAPVDAHMQHKAKLAKLKEENVQKELECFDQIMELIPNGPVLLKEIVEERNGLDTFINFMSVIYAHIFTDFGLQMHQKASNTCSDDTKVLKKAIIEYIPLNLNSTSEVIFPCIQATIKHNQGFNHQQTARLLCPRHKLDEFDIDPSIFIAQVQNGECEIKEMHFPTFLYDKLQHYDPRHKLGGLLEGHL
ncbi:hypothetical protein APHAL10511_007858, partial [Amanita phalloides]